jgi:hypothetical protein
MSPSEAAAARLFETTTRGIEERFGSEPKKMDFIAGGMSELARVAAELTRRDLNKLTMPAPERQRAAFARLLVEQLAEHLPVDQDPLARARARGLLAQRDLLSVEGPALRAAEVAATLKVTRQAIDKRRRAGQLLAVTTGGRGYHYPAWQFTPTGLLPGLQPVLAALKLHPPWAQLRFFVSGNHRLSGKRPLDCLRGRQVHRVLEAAAVFGEQGAA